MIAEEQNSGKGRLSRGWFSPFARGVWFSVVLKPPFMPQEASKCTLLAAIAVVKAVNKYKGVQASIKCLRRYLTAKHGGHFDRNER